MVETDFVEIIPNVDLIKLFENHMLSCLYTCTDHLSRKLDPNFNFYQN